MSTSPDSLHKITDFVLSKQFSSVEVLETFVGTPVYTAQEIIARERIREAVVHVQVRLLTIGGDALHFA